MKRLFLILPLLYLLLPTVSVAEPRVFTEQDLEKYKSPSDKEPSNSEPYLKQNKSESLSEKINEIKKEYGQDYWCLWGNFHNKQVEKAQKEYEEAKTKLSETESAFYRKNATEFSVNLAKDHLERARKQLEEAKDNLSDFEMRAYRKEIPASWHRCQYN